MPNLINVVLFPLNFINGPVYAYTYNTVYAECKCAYKYMQVNVGVFFLGVCVHGVEMTALGCGSHAQCDFSVWLDLFTHIVTCILMCFNTI